MGTYFSTTNHMMSSEEVREYSRAFKEYNVDNIMSSEVRECSEAVKEYNIEASVVLAASSSSSQRLEDNLNEDNICGVAASGARLDQESSAKDQKTNLTSQLHDEFSNYRVFEEQKSQTSTAMSSTTVIQESAASSASAEADAGEKRIGGRHFETIRDCIAELESAASIVSEEASRGHGEARTAGVQTGEAGAAEKRLSHVLLQGSALRSILLSHVEDETDTEDLNKDDINTDTEVLSPKAIFKSGKLPFYIILLSKIIISLKFMKSKIFEGFFKR
jgi:hypothetical protein